MRPARPLVIPSEVEESLIINLLHKSTVRDVSVRAGLAHSLDMTLSRPAWFGFFVGRFYETLRRLAQTPYTLTRPARPLVIPSPAPRGKESLTVGPNTMKDVSRPSSGSGRTTARQATSLDMTIAKPDFMLQL